MRHRHHAAARPGSVRATPTMRPCSETISTRSPSARPRRDHVVGTQVRRVPRSAPVERAEVGAGRVEHLTQPPAGEAVRVALAGAVAAAVDDRLRRHRARGPRGTAAGARSKRDASGFARGSMVVRASSNTCPLGWRFTSASGIRASAASISMSSSVVGFTSMSTGRGFAHRRTERRPPELERHAHAMGESPEQLPLVDHVALGFDDRGRVLRERHREVPLEVPRVVGLLERQLAAEHVVGELRGGAEVYVEAHQQVERTRARARPSPGPGRRPPGCRRCRSARAPARRPASGSRRTAPPTAAPS